MPELMVKEVTGKEQQEPQELSAEVVEVATVLEVVEDLVRLAQQVEVVEAIPFVMIEAKIIIIMATEQVEVVEVATIQAQVELDLECLMLHQDLVLLVELEHLEQVDGVLVQVFLLIVVEVEVEVVVE